MQPTTRPTTQRSPGGTESSSIPPCVIAAESSAIRRDTNSGLVPTEAFQTIDRAIQEADTFLWIGIQNGGLGATINLEPGTYNLNQPVEVPAFGISIELYWSDDPSVEVVIQGAASSDFFRFTEAYSPQTLANLSTNELALVPPSQLRGLHLIGNTSTSAFATGSGVVIDLTQGSAGQFVAGDVAVGVRECEIEATASGVTIVKDPTRSRVFRNEIVSNELHTILYGVTIDGGVTHSDLLRSNEIYDCAVGVRVESASARYPGSLRPRILSNTITNCGSHNLQVVGGLPLSAGVEMIGSVSGQIVGNTIARTRHSCPNPNTCVPLAGYEPAGISYRVGGIGTGETLIIANNILFNPTYVTGGATVNPFEIEVIGAPFPGVLITESNDFDQASPLISPVGTVSPTNSPIADPLFVNGTFGSYDVHLTPASLAVVGLGDPAFTLPGPGSTFAIGAEVYAANCALDVDTDARTSRLAGSAAANLASRGRPVGLGCTYGPAYGCYR